MYQGILTLVRSAINDVVLPLPDGFSLEEAEALIQEQVMLPMVYVGARRCGIACDTPVMQRFRTRYFLTLQKSEKQLRAVQEIFRAFEENSIDYMPLKGCNLKQLYPLPELRIMGDADILIRTEQYDKIKPIMQKLGYEEAGESSYDFCWRRQDLYVELHKRLYGPNQADLTRYFGIGWHLANPGEGYRFYMRAEDEYAYVFCHMMKHFRFSGIGARQIIDLYVFRHAHPEMDETEVERIMTHLKLLDFYCNIRKLLSVWLDGENSDRLTDVMTEYVFKSGSFGTEHNKLYAEELLRANKGTRHARGKSFVSALFPRMRDLQLSYNVLYRYPVLIPLFYVVRWFDILINRRKNIKRKMNIIMGMSDEKVDDHQRLMNAMGLEYDYEE